jgi:hypothetical protein
MCFCFSERTLPTVPESPEEVRVTLATSRSVHLNWRPKYPPTGLIRFYVVRVGVLTEDDGAKKIIWRRRWEKELKRQGLKAVMISWVKLKSGCCWKIVTYLSCVWNITMSYIKCSLNNCLTVSHRRITQLIWPFLPRLTLYNLN